MKKIKIIFILTSLLILGSCETFDLEQTDSRSQVPVQLLDPVYAFNYVQLQLPVFVDDANEFTQRVTRQMAMTGGNTYDNAFKPVNFNTVWSNGYNILNAIKIMEPKSIENNEYYALGASKLIRVYVLMTMVDMFGDIPYSEALQGNANLTPKFDKSADIYKGLLVEIDDAINILNSPNDNSNSDKQDLYYNSKSSWITLANTLKLKLLNNSRLAGSEIGIPDIKTAINNLLASSNIIDTIEEDFNFQYGDSRFNPNTRHPLYNDQYELGGGAYIANYFMWVLSEEKNPTNNAVNGTGIKDPRTDFYFYKQDASALGEDPFIIPFKTRPNHYNNDEYKSFFASNVLCTYFVSNWIRDVDNLPGSGYWGRDHGDNSGIPQDGDKRTVAGVYPIGGKYGSNAVSVQTSGDAGAKGAGIMPILLSSYVHFILAEFQLTENNNETLAKTEMLTGISQSIDKVTTIKNDYPNISQTDRPFPTYPEGVYAAGTIIVDTATGELNTTTILNYGSYSQIIITQKGNYINFVSTRFDDQTTNDKKLELIIKEYYIAAWGNGIEPYNNYRRTGYPSNFQPTLEETSGSFFSTALYPGSVANNNPKMPANIRTKKVFWDKSTKVLH